MSVSRVQYNIHTNSTKADGQALNQRDLVELGYMAGRFGINLDGKSFEHKLPEVSEKGTKIDINSCTTDLFEQTLNELGIAFDKMA